MRIGKLSAVSACIGIGASVWAGPRIAVFDATRQGGVSLSPTNTSVSGLRASLLLAFPGATFVPVPALSTAALAGTDLVILMATKEVTVAITPLSSFEKSVLLSYVQGGGGAVLFTDNDTFGGTPASANANNSLADVFAVVTTGTAAPWPQNTGVASPLVSAVTHGFAGDSSGYQVGWSGWFSNTGGHHVRATLVQNGMPAMLEILRGELSPGSGSVVMFSDTTMIFNGFFNAADAVVVRNAVHAAWRRCGAADLGSQGGLNGPDTTLDNNDFVVFINLFFASDARADVGVQGGNAGADGLFDNNDFVVFINAFFGGC